MDEPDLNRIRQAVFQLINVRSTVEKTEEQLKKYQQKLRELEFEVIPEIMHELNLNKIVLDGIDLELKPFYRASIPIDKRPAAFNWLRDNGHEDLIKRVISVKFGRGQDLIASSLIKELAKRGFAYDDNEQVNHLTLTAWLKEQFERGESNIPLDLLGGYVGERGLVKIEENHGKRNR